VTHGRAGRRAQAVSTSRERLQTDHLDCADPRGHLRERPDYTRQDGVTEAWTRRRSREVRFVLHRHKTPTSLKCWPRLPFDTSDAGSLFDPSYRSFEQRVLPVAAGGMRPRMKPRGDASRSAGDTREACVRDEPAVG